MFYIFISDTQTMIYLYENNLIILIQLSDIIQLFIVTFYYNLILSLLYSEL